MRQHFRMFAAYNQWANQTLYDAMETLSDEEVRHDTGVFFGSLLGTMNHILVADRIWLKRFTGDGTAPSTLNAMLHDDVKALRAAREAEDARIIDWIDNLPATAFSGRFTYLTVTDMRTVSQRLAPALAHFFNHQ